MAWHAEFLAREYEAINAHLRSNIRQFVNWFSLFLTISFAAIGGFVAAEGHWPAFRPVALETAVPLLFLFLHLLAFLGILTFRRYIAAASARIERILAEAGAEGGCSPIPVRFCQWMTDLMAAGFLVSYFVWLALLLLA